MLELILWRSFYFHGMFLFEIIIRRCGSQSRAHLFQLLASLMATWTPSERVNEWL